MATTYTLISSVILSTSAASIEFTSIPATYTDLLVKLSGRSSRSAATFEEFLLTFNNNTSNYSEVHLRGDGSNAIGQKFTGSSIQQVGQPGAGATASTFSNWEIYIPNYAGSQVKGISLNGATENNASVAATYFESGLWADSAAITSIKLSGGAYSVVQHSTAYLYGISNA